MNECILTDIVVESDPMVGYDSKRCTGTVRFLGEPPIEAFTSRTTFCLVPSPAALWGTGAVPSESDEAHFPKPSLLEPSYVMDDGADEALQRFLGVTWKLVGVVAWAAWWWIVARCV